MYGSELYVVVVCGDRCILVCDVLCVMVILFVVVVLR